MKNLNDIWFILGEEDKHFPNPYKDFLNSENYDGGRNAVEQFQAYLVLEKLNFNEIKQHSLLLLSEFKLFKAENKDITSFFEDEALKQREDMILFFRSFDEIKQIIPISPIQFNEKAGFTSEYKDIMTGTI